MPIFVEQDGKLVELPPVKAGPDFLEKDIEDLMWNDLESLTGLPLFPIARQAHLPTGGVTDILALDTTRRVVVIEIKRDIDRRQVAQSLEYAGWALTTNLDQLAAIYDAAPGHSGPEAFFTDWQAFTLTATPLTIVSPPRLILVARAFTDRTRVALDFLSTISLDVTVLPVTFYQDSETRRIISVEREKDIAIGPMHPTTGGGPAKTKYLTTDGAAVRIADLLATDLVTPNEDIEFKRPTKGEHHHATILATGQIQLKDGTVVNSPTTAAKVVTSGGSYDGWKVWHVPRLANQTLDELRFKYVHSLSDASD